MNTLEDRIAKLERKNRFLQCFVILAFVAMGLMGFNYGPQKKIATEELTIVSPTGKTLAVLGSDDDGGLVKVFNTKGAMTSFLMCTDNGGGALLMYQEALKNAVASLSATDRGGHLSINNRDGEAAATITVLENRGGVVGTFKAVGGELNWVSPSD